MVYQVAGDRRIADGIITSNGPIRPGGALLTLVGVDGRWHDPTLLDLYGKNPEVFHSGPCRSPAHRHVRARCHFGANPAFGVVLFRHRPVHRHVGGQAYRCCWLWLLVGRLSGARQSLPGSDGAPRAGGAGSPPESSGSRRR